MHPLSVYQSIAATAEASTQSDNHLMSWGLAVLVVLLLAALLGRLSVSQKPHVAQHAKALSWVVGAFAVALIAFSPLGGMVARSIH